MRRPVDSHARPVAPAAGPLHRHDGVRAGREGGAGHDPHGRAPAERGRWRPSRRALPAHGQDGGHVDQVRVVGQNVLVATMMPRDASAPGWEHAVVYAIDARTGVEVARRVLPDPVPVAMTCGAEEENILNNRSMTAALGEQGYAATLVEVPDLHNYTGWRDALHPHLTRLLARVWPAG